MSLFSSSESESSDDSRESLGREEVRVSSLGRVGFLASDGDFDTVTGLVGAEEDFLEGVAVLEDLYSFFGESTALGCGGVFGRDSFFEELDLCDFSGFAGAEALDAFEAAAAFEAAVVLEGVAVFSAFVDFSGFVGAGGEVRALKCSSGLGHAPILDGGSSTFGSVSFLDFESAFEALAGVFDSFAGVFGSFTGVFGSFAGVFDSAAALVGGAPLLDGVTGGGGASAGNADSPNSCRARSLTLGNIVYKEPGRGKCSGRM
jgi:hypothetical protein